MDDSTFIKILTGLIGVSITIFLKIYDGRDKLLNSIYEKKLSNDIHLNSLKMIENHDRAKPIVHAFYIDAKNQMNIFTYGLVFSVILFLIPIPIYIMKDLGLSDLNLLAIIRYVTIGFTFTWIIYCLRIFKKLEKHNREIINL